MGKHSYSNSDDELPKALRKKQAPTRSYQNSNDIPKALRNNRTEPNNRVNIHNNNNSMIYIYLRFNISVYISSEDLPFKIPDNIPKRIIPFIKFSEGLL